MTAALMSTEPQWTVQTLFRAEEDEDVQSLLSLCNHNDKLITKVLMYKIVLGKENYFQPGVWCLEGCKLTSFDMCFKMTVKWFILLAQQKSKRKEVNMSASKSGPHLITAANDPKFKLPLFLQWKAKIFPRVRVNKLTKPTSWNRVQKAFLPGLRHFKRQWMKGSGHTLKGTGMKALGFHRTAMTVPP